MEMRHTVEICCTASIHHKLTLPYDSPCSNWHGHNYKITIRVSAPELNELGMVIDFTSVKSLIRKYDHPVQHANADGFTQGLNAFIEPSTAENFAEHLFTEMESLLSVLSPKAHVDEVRISETDSTVAICVRA